MIFLPIVQRELRVQARQKRTHRLRLAAGTVGMALVSFMLVVDAGFATNGSMGHGLFALLAWLGLLYCLLAGLGHTVDCLSEEKRAGTLGLLFLTDLKGYDVVLGKLLATSLNSFYGLLAVFPLLAVTFCLGGVTAGEFWRLMLLLTNTLFFSLSVGMFISSLSRDEQRVWVAALGFLAVLGFLPVLTLRRLFDAGYSFAPGAFWGRLVAIDGVSGVLLGLASVILPRAWQDRPAARNGWSALILSATRLSLRWRGRRTESVRACANPVFWLASRQTRSANFYLWVAVLSAGGAGLAAMLLSAGSPEVLWTIATCALGFHFLLAIWVAFQAAFLLGEARSSGTVEFLLSTPLHADEVVNGYFLSLKTTFKLPIAVWLATEGVILIGGLISLGWREPSGAPPMLLFAAAFFMSWFISDLFAVGRFGMWMGISSKKPSLAFMKTVLYVMVLPLFAIFLCTLMFPLVGLLKNAIFINYADEQLCRHFRTAVTEGAPQKRQAVRLPSVIADDSGA